MRGWNLASLRNWPGKGWDKPCRPISALANLPHPKLNSFHIPETRLSRAPAGSCSPGSTRRQIHGIAGPTAATAPGEATSARWDALGREWAILGTSPRVSGIEATLHRLNENTVQLPLQRPGKPQPFLCPSFFDFNCFLPSCLTHFLSSSQGMTSVPAHTNLRLTAIPSYASPSSLSAPADLMHCYHSYLSKAQPSINMLQNYQWVPHAYRIKPKLLLPGIHRPLWSGSYQLFRLMSLSHLSLLFFRKTDELPISYVFPSFVPLLTLFLLPKMLPSQFFFLFYFYNFCIVSIELNL